MMKVKNIVCLIIMILGCMCVPTASLATPLIKEVPPSCEGANKILLAIDKEIKLLNSQLDKDPNKSHINTIIYVEIQAILQLRGYVITWGTENSCFLNI